MNSLSIIIVVDCLLLASDTFALVLSAVCCFFMLYWKCCFHSKRALNSLRQNYIFASGQEPLLCSWQKVANTVSPSSNPVGEIGAGYPTNVYDCNRLSVPILRQKMAQSYGMMFIDLPDCCCYGDENTQNTFPVSAQKITQSNQMMNNWIKQHKQNRTEVNLK
jgi:hypothetical protein